MAVLLELTPLTVLATTVVLFAPTLGVTKMPLMLTGLPFPLPLFIPNVSAAGTLNRTLLTVSLEDPAPLMVELPVMSRFRRELVVLTLFPFRMV